MEQRLKELDQVLDEYEAKVGLPVFDFADNEATAYLNLTHAQLQKMTPVDCGEAAFTLQKFAAHLQRAVNRERARVKWADENIRRIIARTVGGVKGYSLEERRPLAILNDDVATKFDRVRVHAEVRLTRLDFMAGKVDNMARALMALQQSKRGYRD